MTSGGARNRSGPKPDPRSGRSDRRGLSFRALPADGYHGEVPAFPLSPAVVLRWEYGEKGARHQVRDEEETEDRREREAELWGWAWESPQAVAWADESWRWHSVAMWVRLAALCESPDALAADKATLLRFADQIGMTPAGLRENGWTIEAVQAEVPAPAIDRPASSRARLTIVKPAAPDVGA